MTQRVCHFEHDGKAVLGFDTGLGAQAFAQAKMASYMSGAGFIARPDGAVEPWRPEGVAEKGTMFIWGPAFPGEELADLLAAPGRRDEALDAVRLWLRARIAVASYPMEKKEDPFPGLGGARIAVRETRDAAYPEGTAYPAGTVFFPPARLFKRSLEAEGNSAKFEAESWAHPDLEGAEAVSFSSGAALYRVFSGAHPFPLAAGESLAGSPPERSAEHSAAASSPDWESLFNELRQNIREEVFIPPRLASPGLDPEMAETISRAMSRVPQAKEEKRRPAPESIRDFIGPPSSKPASSWIAALDEAARAKIGAEKERYGKKKAFAVKTRRFMVRNTAIIAGVLIGAAVVAALVNGAIRHRASLPTTKGMTPVEVAETYYGAFGPMDHILMEACVSGKAGKNDIETAVNLFVLARVRQAYETSASNTMTAQEWLDAGRPETDKIVFGVTDLKLQTVAEGDAEVGIDADYSYWMPGVYQGTYDSETLMDPAAELRPPPPDGQAVRDRLTLAFEKGAWRIVDIDRTSRPL